MSSKRLLEGLNYRQAQKRNSEQFNSFNKKQQKEIRQQGYKNVGWDNVCKSWNILQIFISSQPLNFINFAIKKAELKYKKAKKTNDVVKVLKAGKSFITALKMKYK